MSDTPSLVEVLVRQRAGWERGDRPLVEQLLHLHPHLRDDPDAVLDLIYNETLLREEAGEVVSLTDYLPHFPHLESALRTQLEVEESLSPPPASSSEPPRPTSPQQGLDGCDLLDELGRGAMGVVYRGWQRGARRPVAVKILSADVPAARVVTEAEAAARLLHPGIVQVFEVKEHQGQTALVLEYVEGGNLAEKLQGKPQPPGDSARLVEALARAMAHAHRKGVIHRDLKPCNVLLSAGPDEPLGRCVPKIGDFGLARLLEASHGLTATADVLGTPSYMAPEQTGGPRDAVGPAADIWALGAILYECLTGRPPFLGETVLGTLEQVRHQDPVPPSRLQPRTSSDLETICLKCLQKDPRRRYPTADDLADDLGRFLAGQPIHARPVGFVERAWKWAGRRPTAAALAVIGLAAFLLLAGAAAQVHQVLRRQRDLAIRQAGELEGQLQQTRRLLYTAQLLRVGSVWEADPAQARQMLEDPNLFPPDLRCFSWGVLLGQCRRHRSADAGLAVTTALAYHPGGTILASGDAAGGVFLHDPATAAVLARLDVHPTPLIALVFTPEGRLLAGGGADGTVQLWEMPAGRRRGRFRVPEGHLSGLAWLGDGQTLVVAAGAKGKPGRVQLWNAQAERFDRSLPGDTHPDSPVAVSPDGGTIACAGPDHRIRLWDVRTGRSRAPLRGHTTAVTALLFPGQGRRLLSGGRDGLVIRWDPDREGRRETVAALQGPVAGLALHPDGQVLCVAGSAPQRSNSQREDGRVVADVQLWDLITGKTGKPLRGHPGGATAVAFSPDGQSLATAGTERSIVLWDHPRRRVQVPLRGHSGRAATVTLSGDGKTLAWISAGSPGQEINVLDLGTGALLNVFRGHGRPIQALALAEEGQHLVSAAGHAEEPAEVLIWEVRTGRLVQAFSGHTGPVIGVAFAQGSREVVSAGQDGFVRVWDVATGRSRLQLGTGGQVISALAISGDGSRLAAAAGREVFVWERRTGAVEHRLVVGARVQCLALTPAGDRFAWSGGEAEVRLVDTRSGVARESLAVGMKGVVALAFSPEGQTLAVAGTGVGVKLWDVHSAQERASLPGHPGGACFVGFARDGQLLVTASASGGARLWPRLHPE